MLRRLDSVMSKPYHPPSVKEAIDMRRIFLFASMCVAVIPALAQPRALGHTVRWDLVQIVQGTALALHVCDAIFCRLLASNNGYARNAWTAAGLIAGVWAVGVLILLPRRAASGAPPRPLR